MIERHELEAWLGPALEELSDDQIDRLHREAQAIHDRWPDPDDDDLRDAALSAAVQLMLGEITPGQAAQQLVSARAAALRASAAAQQIAAMLCADGMSEVDAARAVGITRRTLRIALGKGPR